MGHYKSYRKIISIPVDVSINEDPVKQFQTSLDFECTAWDNGEIDPTLHDSDHAIFLLNKSSVPEWVTSEMRDIAEETAKDKFLSNISDYEQ